MSVSLLDANPKGCGAFLAGTKLFPVKLTTDTRSHSYGLGIISNTASTTVLLVRS